MRAKPRAWWALPPLLVVFALVWWLDHDAAPQSTPLDPVTLAQLSDDALERALRDHLGQRLLGPSGDAAAWQHLPEAMHHYWALTMVEQWIHAYGLAAFLQVAETENQPGVRAASAACTAMDLPEVAQLCNEVAAAPSHTATAIASLQRRLIAALDQPTVKTARCRYLRLHLADLTLR
jgi:hypothetical protein